MLPLVAPRGAVLALLCALLSATTLPLAARVSGASGPTTSPGFRLRERVLYYGEAKFQGINVPTAAAQRASLTQPASEETGEDLEAPTLRSTTNSNVSPGLSGVSAVGSAEVLNLPVAKGNVRVWNGTNMQQSVYSGVGEYFNTSGFNAQPGPSLCVGSGFVVQVVNCALSVYDAMGNLKAGLIDLNQFLGLLPYQRPGDNTTGDLLSYPTCVYDNESKRFFFSIWWGSGDGPSTLDIFGQARKDPYKRGSGTIVAASAKKDPTLPWKVYFIPGTNDGLNSNNDTAPPLNYTSNTTLQSYPRLTVDSNGVYLQTNSLDGDYEFIGKNIVAMSKKSLINGVFTFEATRFAIPYSSNNFQEFGILPAVTAGDSHHDSRAGGSVYFVSTLRKAGPLPPQTNIGLYVLTNTASLSTDFPDLRLSYVSVPTPEFIYPNSTLALQKEGPIPYGASLNDTNVVPNIYSGRFKPTSAAWQNGRVVFTFNIAVGDGMGVAYAIVRPVVRVVKGTKMVDLSQSYLEKLQQFGVPGQSLLYPAVGMNRKRKILIAFSLVGPDYYPTAAYVTINARGKLDPRVKIAAAGNAPIESPGAYQTPGVAGLAVFGDWQTVVVDGNGRAWGTVEYVSGVRSVQGNWATLILSLALP